MALFRRGDDHDNRWADENGWITDRMSDGTIFRWRVRMERIGNIHPEDKEALEAVAREEGYTYRGYVTWAANLTNTRMNDTRDRVRKGLAGPRGAALYQRWLGVRLAVHEVQYPPGGAPGEVHLDRPLTSAGRRSGPRTMTGAPVGGFDIRAFPAVALRSSRSGVPLNSSTGFA